MGNGCAKTHSRRDALGREGARVLGVNVGASVAGFANSV